MTTTILRGDCRQTMLTLPENSVHMAVTSPPYWALRSYLKAGDPLKALELGCEPTPELYLANMVEVFRAVRRVLRDDGTLWVNIGDTYCCGTSAPRKKGGSGVGRWTADVGGDDARANVENLAAGNRVGIPERFALAMQADGWWWRDTIIWHKPAPMPSSVNGWRWERCRVKTARGQYANETHPDSYKGSTPQGGKANRHCVGGEWVGDAVWSPCPGCPKCAAHNGWVLRKGSWRTTAAHEYIYLFTKSDSYFCDREAAVFACGDDVVGGESPEPESVTTLWGEVVETAQDDDDSGTANPRSVWTIGPQPCRHKHYAAYPEELPRRVIQAGTPDRGCCPACGAPWARMVEVERSHQSGSGRSGNAPAGKNGTAMQGGGATGDVRNGPCVESRTVGWLPTCDCASAEPVPCTVLDPFGGSGTTAIAAEMMGRNAILSELNPEYVDIMAGRRAETAPLLLEAN
jgi:DNA modification methylase